MAGARELDRPVRKLGHEEQATRNQGAGGVDDVRVAEDERPGVAPGDEHEGRRNEPRASENERDCEHEGAAKREEAKGRLLERGVRRQSERSGDRRDAGS